MAKHYVTFGSVHVHKINGKLLHSNVVARFDTENAKTGREKAFELFGRQFSFEYHETEWDEKDQMKYYLGGYVDI